MERLLKRATRVSIRARSALQAGLAAASLAAPLASAQTAADDHQWLIEIDTAANVADTRFATWTEGGVAKLRFDESDDGFTGRRLLAEYRGRFAPTLWGNAVLDYAGDASSGVGVTELYLDWRPLPNSSTRHQWRFGAFYPPLSPENKADGWSSPYTISYSAVNSWLGEEIRPIGAQWSMRRRIGFAGSPHEIGAFAGAFYGNDPAGTLLFWRGWSLHDRQSRLGDRFTLPPIVLRDDAGNLVRRVEHELEPFVEIDGKPGVFGGLKWQYSRRAALQLAFYDNRADPYAFDDGQWGWHTRFVQASAQLDLPWRLGLLAQWLAGKTNWIIRARADGTLPPSSELVSDDFEAKYVLMTRFIGEAHALTLRIDEFDYRRPADPRGLVPDTGSAWTFAYRYRRSPRLAIALEWLEIASTRDVNPLLLDAPPHAREQALQMKLTFSLGPAAVR